MPEYPARPRNRVPTHPGEVVADVLGTLRVTQRAAARAMHVSPMALGNIINGKTDVSPHMALKLGKLFGNGPELWLNMQRDYTLWCASHDKAIQAELAGIKPLEAA
jgi:addiction module HigA family antidote